MQVIRIGDELTHVKDVAVEAECMGIAFFQLTFIVGFTSPAPRVVRMSEEGKILNTLRYDSSGVKLFSRPEFIHVKNTTDSSRIFVSDLVKKTVYMLDDGLRLLQAFKIPSRGKPYGLADDERGNVLVVDGGTHTLQLLDLTTGQWRTLLRKEEWLRRPVCLVYNQAMNKLYFGGNEDVVKVYTVSE